MSSEKKPPPRVRDRDGSEPGSPPAAEEVENPPPAIDPVRPRIGEAPGNLARRSSWFKHRSGSIKG
jgi:hypothetical protein